MTQTTLRDKGERRRETAAAWSRERTASVAEIGELPKVKNPKRKLGCRYDLHKFLVSYFPNSTGLSPFSGDHLRVISRIERCILEGGRFVNAVYRGFAKTTISENAAIWALLYGHRRFVVLFGADAKAAAENMESIQLELETNDLLYDDFPEACHAIRKLEGKYQRAVGQLYRGQRTYIEWTAERLVMPRISKSLASGAVIVCRGITAGFRGLKKKLPDGTQPRPDLIIPDDPQTDESASTALQVNKTLALFRKGITKLGTHRRSLALVVNATVIYPQDAVDQLLADPSWQGERIPLVRQWPACHETLWLGKYAAIRADYDKNRVGDQARAWEAATDFYRANRKEMDAGAVVSWDSCYDPDRELSALQHAYNALIDDGREAFQSEYQVDPLPREEVLPGDVTAAAIMARVNRHERGVVPSGAARLTAFIDVQQDLLYYVVCGWSEGFGGSVVDYGMFPDQMRAYFALRDARPTLSKVTGVPTVEGSIYAGLGRLTDLLLSREWEVDGGGVTRIERCLIDAAWGQSYPVVMKFVRQSQYAALLTASIGKGISAAQNPMSDWPRHKGERRGQDWVYRLPKPGQPRQLVHCANSWKSFVASRLLAPMGEQGALSLFGDKGETHRLFADHCVAEYRVRTKGRGRELDEWKLKADRPDNHWWDCLVGCAVAASFAGVSTPELAKPQRKERRRVSYAEMQMKARYGR